MWLLLIGLFSPAECWAVSTALSGRSWALVGASFFEAFSIKEAGFSEDKFGGA